jgi:hypothetical protein
MRDRDDLPLELALDRHWDEIVRGEPAGSPEHPLDPALDPGLAATVRRVHELDEAPPADPAFAARLWEDLMHAQGAVPAPRPRPFRDRPPAAAPAAPPHPGRRALAWFATAALVLLTLGAAYLALGPGRPTPERANQLPAIVTSPVPSPATPAPDGASADEALLAVELPADALPRTDQVSAGLSVVELPPGHEAAWSASAAAAYPGLRVEYLLEGTYAVRPETAVRVVRADGADEAVPGGAEVLLAPGDALVSRADAAFAETNPGPAPAVLLSWVLLDGAQRAAPGPGIRMESPLAVYDRAAAPAGPAALRLRRVELAPDAVLPAPAGAFQIAATERGAPSVGRESDGAVSNPGGETATVYVLTLEPAAPGDGAAAGSPAP